MLTMRREWKRTVRFRDLLSDDSSAETAVRVGKQIAERVAKAIPETDKLRDDELTEIIERLSDDVEDCEDLNEVLSDLYDWGDTGKRLFVSL